jgi:hypothetical protein
MIEQSAIENFVTYDDFCQKVLPHLQHDNDERLRILIESCMKEHPSYGYRRVSQCLKINHKQAQRVMQKFNLKPFRRCKTPSKPDEL